MQAIRIQQLTLQYPKAAKRILDGVTTEFNRGTVNVVLGNNGTGKTTLFKCISGMIDYYSGNIDVNGDIAYISDQIDLYDYLTVAEYMNYLVNLSDGNKGYLDELVYNLQLEEIMDQRIQECSLGERYKIILMTYLFLDFQIIIIDEPLTQLDIHCQAFMFHLLKYVAREGKTIILSTHMMKVAYDVANYIYLIHNGKIIKQKNTFLSFEEFQSFVKHQQTMIADNNILDGI